MSSGVTREISREKCARGHRQYTTCVGTTKPSLSPPATLLLPPLPPSLSLSLDAGPKAASHSASRHCRSAPPEGWWIAEPSEVTWELRDAPSLCGDQHCTTTSARGKVHARKAVRACVMSVQCFTAGQGAEKGLERRLRCGERRRVAREINNLIAAKDPHQGKKAQGIWTWRA